MYWKIFTQWFLNCSLSIQQQKKINSIALSVKKKFSESPSLLYYNSVLKPSRKQLFDWYRSISFWEPKRKWFQLFLIIIFHYYTSAENWKNHKKSFFPYYSKTFVVTFLKYKIDPESLLTQHDLFRTRKMENSCYMKHLCVCT